MTVRRTAAVTAVTAATLSVLGAAPALAACDAYSGRCVQDTSAERTADRSRTQTSVQAPATLPFTGGELVLLTATGAAALAGGTALVVAGRRRSA